MSERLAIVTGAPGWLGTGLLKALVEGLEDSPELPHDATRPVRALVLEPAGQSLSLSQLGENVEVIGGDLTEKSKLAPLFADASGATVFHCAGIVHPTHGVKQFYAVNVEGTRNMLELARAAGIRRFIHVSSNSPFGFNRSRDKLFDETFAYAPYMNYGKSKMQAEELVKSFHAEGEFETVIIRPPWFYGPGQPARQTQFFTMIKSGRVPIVGSGDNLRSMAYIDNICQSLILCETTATAAGKCYWIADQRPYSMNQVVDTIESLLEHDFSMTVAHRRVKVPDLVSEAAQLADAGLQAAGLYHQKVHVLSEMNKNIACSVALAESELGYKPKIALKEGMRRSIAWVLEQGQVI